MRQSLYVMRPKDCRSSAEQRFADVAARLRARRDREDGAADVLDVLVERVVRAEPALDRDELLFRVALEADEEEAGFELAEALVDAVGEGVAAAQDPLAVVGRRRRRGGRGRWPGSPAARSFSASRSSGSNSSLPPSGAPLYLRRPIVCSWSSSEERSQTSSSIRIRRVTM